MKTNKLELKHIAPYLYYGLIVRNKSGYNCKISNIIVEYSDLVCINEYGEEDTLHISDIKPILRPLSSMTNDEAYDLFRLTFKGDCLDEDFPVELCVWGVSLITVSSSSNGSYKYIRIEVLDGVLSIKVEYSIGGYVTGSVVSYSIYEWLFKHHFDVFNLIDNNLAIDKTKM